MPVAVLEELLHLHRACNAIRAALEDDHEPVADVLHLVPAGLLHGFAEDREMLPSQLLGRGRTDRRRQPGGPDEIGEEDRYGLDGAHRVAPVRVLRVMQRP